MSYTLNKTGVQIDAILDRAETGGEIDQELALKAPLASPALTGTPTAPTPADGDNSTKIATTAFVKAATGQLIEESIGPDDILSVPDGADNVPMLSLKAYITAVQSGSGTPSPDNPRPISGWTGAEAVRTGVNLLDATGFEQGGLVIGAEGTDYSAAKVANNGRIRLANLFYIPEGTTFTVSIKTGYDFCIYRYDKYGKAKGSASGYVNAPTTETSYGAVGIALKFTNSADITPSEALNAEIQLEVGSTATTYEAYSGTTYPLTWTDEAGTVYGGYVDLVSGELVVTMASKTYNNASGFSLSHTSGGYGAFIANISGAKRFTDASQIISNELEVGDYSVNPEYWNSPSRNVVMTDISSVEGRFGLVLQGVMDTTDLGTWLTANPLQLVYELATPLSYSLTGLSIPTLKGENNVWSDVGQSEMTYYADLKAYIDKKIAEAL